MSTILSLLSQWLGQRQVEHLIVYAALLDLVVSSAMVGVALPLLGIFAVQALLALARRRVRLMVNRLFWVLGMLVVLAFALAGVLNSVDSLT